MTRVPCQPKSHELKKHSFLMINVTLLGLLETMVNPHFKKVKE